MEIGDKIRSLRLSCGLTQEELADRAELTKGFISQLERDLTSPSLASLVDILSCLGTDLREFFSDSEDTSVVFTQADTFTKQDEEKKYALTWLVPNAQANEMEPVLVELDAGGVYGPEKPHAGEEFGYVLDGSIVLTLGSRRIRVKKGESFYIDSSLAHGIANDGRVEARVLWVATPPSF